MVKKFRSKQRGIQRGVQKHKVCQSKKQQDAIGSSKKQLISYFARLCWSYLTKACCKLNLVPLQIDADGDWELCSLNRRLIHYILLAIGLGLLARNLAISAYRLFHDGGDLITILCLAIFFLSAVSAAAALGSTWSALEMKDVLNSWSPSLRFIEEATGNKVSCFDSTADNLKVIGCTYIYNVAPLNVALACMLFENIPTSCFGSLYSLGMIPESILPNLFWRILLSPLELLLALSQAYTAVFNVSTLALGSGLIRAYCNEMR